MPTPENPFGPPIHQNEFGGCYLPLLTPPVEDGITGDVWGHIDWFTRRRCLILPYIFLRQSCGRSTLRAEAPVSPDVLHALTADVRRLVGRLQPWIGVFNQIPSTSSFFILKILTNTRGQVGIPQNNLNYLGVTRLFTAEDVARTTQLQVHLGDFEAAGVQRHGR